MTYHLYFFAEMLALPGTLQICFIRIIINGFVGAGCREIIAVLLGKFPKDFINGI